MRQDVAEGANILVVDDEPRGVELLARTLRKLGHVETATSGAEAWEIAQRVRIDLVVSDQRMPGMTGVELLNQIAERDEHVGRVILTGYADLDATVDAINLGRVHAYLRKPCPPEHLRVTVRSVLDHVRLAREHEVLIRDLRDKNTALESALRELRTAQEKIVHGERLSAIGRMAAMIVHDFRGPLSVIRSAGGDVSREAKELPEAELRELGDTVREEADRLNEMCAELLEVTRAGAGLAERVETDLDEVVEDAMAAVAEEAALAGVRVETDLASGAKLPLDERRMRRALLNLAYNAVEAMGDGGVLRIATARENGEARVVVADTGPGIPEEIRDRIFEPFVTSGKSRGSGLGLAVVKKVLEDHGGRIDVDKAEGGGTAFRLRLPLARGG